MKNININNLISLAEDSLYGVFENKLSAKDSVFQAHCKADAREGKDPSTEIFVTEEEAAEKSLLDIALESAIEDRVLTFNDYIEWLQANHLNDSDEHAHWFRYVKKAVETIFDCLHCPRLIEDNKNWLGEEAVKVLQYITSGGINHKAPAFVIA